MTRKVGILFGMENTFPGALATRINDMKVPGVEAEFLKTGGVRMNQPSGYRVIIDRISQDIPFYRAYLKNAALGGTVVINNPFWWTADDKFFNYALAERIGVAVPRTVILPHKQHPPGTTDQSMRNLVYPLNWDEIFNTIGFPAFLKPYSGGGWKSVYKVHSPEEFFAAYDQTGDLCMTLQQAIDFLNPAPDADYHSVGPENFAWVVNAVAEFAVQKALSDERPEVDYHWSHFLSGGKMARAAPGA